MATVLILGLNVDVWRGKVSGLDEAITVEKSSKNTLQNTENTGSVFEVRFSSSVFLWLMILPGSPILLKPSCLDWRASLSHEGAHLVHCYSQYDGSKGTSGREVVCRVYV